MPRATEAGDQADPTGPDDSGELESLARDWITLWQSEIAALAADPETAETTARLAALWAGAATAMLRPMAGAAPTPAPTPAPAHDQNVGTGAAAAPGATAPAAAPDAGLDALLGVLGRLDERIGAIERRLATLESSRLRHDHGAQQGRPGAPKRGRRRP